jgi:hypothetical protein
LTEEEEFAAYEKLAKELANKVSHTQREVVQLLFS